MYKLSLIIFYAPVIFFGCSRDYVEVNKVKDKSILSTSNKSSVDNDIYPKWEFNGYKSINIETLKRCLQSITAEEIRSVKNEDGFKILYTAGQKNTGGEMYRVKYENNIVIIERIGNWET